MNHHSVVHSDVDFPHSLFSDEPRAAAAVKTALSKYLKLDSKLSFVALCDQIILRHDTVEDESRVTRK